MENYVLITKEEHEKKFWRRPADFRFLEGINYVPILLAEVSQAVLSFPLVFVKEEEGFVFSALLGLGLGKNLFVNPEGRWLSSYLPAVFRAYPFSLAKLEDGNLALAVRQGFVSDQPGIPFFEGSTLSKETQEVLNLLVKLEVNRTLTQQACETVINLNLLEPWPIRVKAPEGEYQVTNVFRINEAKLHSLSDEEFLSLRRTRGLLLVYGQLFSAGNLSLLGWLAQREAQLKPRAELKPKETSLVNLEDLEPETLFKNLKFPED